MKKLIKYLGIALAIMVVLGVWPAVKIYAELSKSASEDPQVWEEDIQALEERHADGPGAILFMGSSSIRLWGTLAQDMQPMTVVNRGFGGAKIADTVFYASRLVDIEQPSAIVIFVGTNDIHPGATKKPAVVLASYQELVLRITTSHGALPIYYIAITPSLMRWDVWPIANEANKMIESYSDTVPNLHFIDTGDALMKNDAPNKDYYVIDGLHLNKNGYRLWTQIIRPRLLDEVYSKTPK
ncbi:MAG: GDSL-type esterase/lipase family protein [Halioglobus sp.]